MPKMRLIDLPRVRCLHCGHTWTPRINRPKWCPKCMYPDIEVIKKEDK